MKVPGKVLAKAKAALGPLAKRFPLLYPGSVLVDGGLDRSLTVGDGEGPDVAKVLTALDAHDLPLVSLRLTYPNITTQTPGTSAGAAAMLKAALAPAAVAKLRRLAIQLHKTELTSAASKTIAAAVKRMPHLRDLAIVCAKGTFAPIIAAAPPLHSLRLEPLTELALNKAKALAALERLDVRVTATDAQIATFLAPFKSLTELRLGRTDASPVSYRGVAKLAGLTSLELHRVDKAGVAAVAAAPFVPALCRLHLYDAALDDALAKQLAKQGLPALEYLNVKFHVPVKLAGLDAIVKAAPKLMHIEVPGHVKVPASWKKRGRTIL